MTDSGALSSIIKNYPWRIILGSASPRRQELLKSLGFSFTCQPIAADESIWPDDLKAHEIPLYLAGIKAKAFPGVLSDQDLLITSDTVVWCENRVYNKPADFEDGKKMLRALSGRMHEVFTAVCLKTTKFEIFFYDTSRVFFKNFSDAEIEYYLENYRPYDKAGAYGAQDWLGYTGIEKIEGSFYNVMGLPVSRVVKELKVMNCND